MSNAGDMDRLPEQWRAAFARDKEGVSDFSDPQPERRAAGVLAAYIIVGLCFLALPGTFLGVWNLLSIAGGHAATAASTAWIQAHGQAQLLGWVGTFILGISLYALPKFRGHALKRFGMAWAVWVLWTVGVSWRWWAGIAARPWPFGLIVSAALLFVAFGLFQYILLSGSGMKTQGGTSGNRPHDLGSWLGILGFVALGLALLLNVAISIFLAVHGLASVYPPKADRTLLVLEIWGFVVPVAWGYSTRFVTVFLCLRQASYRAAPWLGGGVVGIILCAALRQYWLADLLALVTTGVAIWALRVFHRSVRPPKLQNAYRHYPIFVRVAYAWLAIGALMGLWADAMPRLSGLTGASRHSITVGFIATLIFALAPRILPSFLNGRQLYSTQLAGASMWLLNVGCALRVSSESVAYSIGGMAWRILPISAFIELAAVLLFVVNMGRTLAGPIPAWLSPNGVNPALPLYWYVASFPKTKAVLVQAGLKTLSLAREIPRSLTLTDAARADAADIECVLAGLRTFFGKRQPRRARRIKPTAME